MCGLQGVMSKPLLQSDINVFQDLMVLGILRGWQGAGVAAIPQDKEAQHVSVLRSTSNGANFVLSDGFHKMIDKPKIALLGHTRLPTKGAATDIKNVHPHRVKHIIMTHNGTMHDVAEKPIPEGASDSAMLAESIAEIGLPDTVKTSRGAMALVYVDDKAKTINFFRNDERPLYLAYSNGTNNSHTIYWSSNADFLDLILCKNRNYKPLIMALPVNKWVVYEYPFIGAIRPVHEEVLRKPETFFQPKGNKHYEDWWARQDRLGRTQNTSGAATGGSERSTNTATRGDASGTQIVQVGGKNTTGAEECYDWVRLPPTSLWIKRTDMEEAVLTGCSWCSQQPRVEKPGDKCDHAKQHWMSKTEYICEECVSDDPEVRRYLNMKP
jgi:hypothetical protein